MVINSIPVSAGITGMPRFNGQKEMQKAPSRTDKNTGRSGHSSLYRLEFMYRSFQYRSCARDD
jgi:hypothetical protein